MASTGAVGGSQIDVQGLAAQLIAADRATPDAAIQRETQDVTTKISALGTLMGSMSSFRSALSSLNSIDVFSTRTAVSSDPDVFTATGSAKAVPGSYNIEVVQLAKAEQISSDPFAGGSTSVVGTGTLSLSVGAKSFSVSIDSTKSTLAGIRDAINSASDNPGIRATLVQGTDGSRLVLSSASTGAANQITIGQSGGDGGLAALTYSAAAADNYTQLSAAQDAIVKIAGAQSTSSTNTLDGAIDGVTLTLLKPSDPDEPATSLTIGYDSAAVKTRITNFVNAYNALETQIAKLRSYDPTTKVAGPMIGDSLLSGIENQMRSTVSNPVAGQNPAFQTLAAIGITTQDDGTLGIDDAKLQKALDTNFEQVGKLFGSDQGVGTKLFTQMDTALKSGGGIDNRNKNLVAEQKDISDRQDALDERMTALQKTYVQQFTALDTLLSQLQVTSSYMSQQLQGMQNSNAS
ncbi:MAG TPA: flagellar filament capping protein FliD [Steroidobacteraceae bacterium]|jgi:flagellar hook-associated protein 2